MEKNGKTFEEKRGRKSFEKRPVEFLMSRNCLYYSLNEAARLQGVTPQTIRNWDKEARIESGGKAGIITGRRGVPFRVSRVALERFAHPGAAI